MSCCTAYNCSQRYNKNNNIRFHSFPLKNKDLLKKWKIAMRREESWKPTVYSRICGTHFLSSDYYPGSRELLKTSVPSVFDFPEHLQKSKPIERRELKRTLEPVEDLVDAAEDIMTKPKKIKTSPSKEDLKAIINDQKRKVKALQQKVRRKETKITCLSSVVEDLKNKSLIDDRTAIKLDEKFSGLTMEIIQNQLQNQNRDPRGRRYSDEVKKFALTLSFYSPRAYEYLRRVFSLPHSNSLGEWTSSVNCEPGFFMDVLKSLKEKINKNPTHAECALLCDAMSIMSSVVYNNSTGNYDGYVNYGPGIVVPDEDIVAKEALVFMLVSFRGHWKYPVGYVLDDKINAKDLNCLLSRIIDLCAMNDIKIRCVTSDGTSVNFNAMKLFGCEFGKTLDKINGSFTHEAYDYKIYFTPDPPHMLKLTRNALGDLRVFMDYQNRSIEWRFITSLHAEQTKEGLKFANKLSNSHINFHRNKMNVQIACQTLSSSVADSIEFLMNSGHPSFQNAEGTIEFIRVVDKLYDLLNVRNPHGRGFKQALRLEKENMWNETIESSIKYLLALKDINGTPLILHRRKTFITGFIVCALSTRMLALELLNKNFFSYFLTYKFSQDHLELLFACIRGKNGFNNNPDIRTFKSALKRILLRASIVASKHANCITFEEEASSPIFSLKWSKSRTPLCTDNDFSSEDDSSVDILDIIPCLEPLSPYKEAILGYIGGYIVKKLSRKISCQTCYQAMISAGEKVPAHHLITSKDRGGLLYPSEDVLKILKTCEIVFKGMVSGDNFQEPKINQKSNLNLKLRNMVLRTLPCRLFSDLECDFNNEIVAEDLHSFQVTKEVITWFMKIRLFRYGQYFTQMTLKKGKSGVRQKLNKMVLFQGL